jgi:hypothetical protein
MVSLGLALIVLDRVVFSGQLWRLCWFTMQLVRLCRLSLRNIVRHVSGTVVQHHP